MIGDIPPPVELPDPSSDDSDDGYDASASSCSQVGDESNQAGGGCQRRPSCSVSLLAECSHGKREALGSSPGRAAICSSPVACGDSVWVRG